MNPKANNSQTSAAGGSKGMGGYMELAGEAVTDIAAAFTSDDDHRGQAQGKAIGSGIGGVFGGLIGGPMGAAAGAKVGGTVGTIIGKNNDRDRIALNNVRRTQKQNWQLNLNENIDPYGSFEDGGLVSEGPGDPVAPKDYKPSNAQQRNNWNKFLDYLGEKKVGGSADLDRRDQSLGMNYMKEYNTAFPQHAVDSSFIPVAQYESHLIRKQRTFPGLTPEESKYAFGQMKGPFVERELSPVDGWLGSYTSKQYYPQYQRGEKGKSTSFGADFETFVRSLPAEERNKAISKFEDGGMVSQEMMEQEQPQVKMINIEKDELMVTNEGDIIQEFNNPNRFSKHARNKFLEPSGNFIEAPIDAIIIPKKKAKVFKDGNKITRQSIIGQILKEQALDPNFNNPDKDAATPEEFGGGGGVNPKVGPLLPSNRAIMNFNDVPRETQTQPVINPQVLALQQGIVDINPSNAKGFETNMNAIQQGSFNASLSGIDPNSPGDQPVTKKKAIDWNTIGRRGLAMLPGAMQAIESMGGDPDLAMVRNRGYGVAKSYTQQMPESINVNDQIADADQALAAAMATINGASPSAQAQAAVVAANIAKAKGDIRANASRTNTQLRTNKLQQLAGLEVAEGQSDQQEMLRYQLERRMNAAAGRNIRNNAASEAYTNFALQDNDDKRIAIINSISKFVDIDPAQKQLLVEDPNAQQYVTDYIMAHAGTASMNVLAREALSEYEMQRRNKTVNSTERTTNGQGIPVQTKQKTTTIKG